MKFSLSWLKDHLDTDADVATIAARLNAIGLEVEGIDNPAERLEGFTVARVLTAAPHPQADKLQILTVDRGDGVPLQVVCGAPNARAGLVGVLGSPGAVVPANGMELKKAAIRGIESNGMMCSVRELELGDEHDGIIELSADAPVGLPFAAFAGLDDPVLDVAVTPNRPDAMGVYGIARDLAAAGLGTLRPVETEPVAGSFPCPVEIRTDDPEGCPAFFGRVIRNVRNGPSPAWMQARLKSAGQRPISALVDITNYVMLAYGRPSHAYDLAQLKGGVFARRATDGEGVTALNGKAYVLDSSMTVIADDAGVHDIAGIMGGEHSGCSDATTDVLLEVAYFDPERISRTGQALALASDARSRFERGVDPDFLDPGINLITRLITEVCGGEVSEVLRAGAPPAASHVVGYDPALCGRLGGIDVPHEEQKRILDALGFTVVATAAENGERWLVTAPGWRRDIDGAPDIVEEVVRIHGLEHVPSTALLRAPGVARPTATPAQARERRVRRAAAARGLVEAITWSFLPEGEAAAFGGGVWSLANPLSEDLKVMRPSLLPGLLAATRRNQARGMDSVRLFEIGRRYLVADDGTSAERETLALILAGDRNPRGWASGKAVPFDAFDAKAETLALLAEAGAPVESLQVSGEAGEQFHPGQSATLRLGPKTVLARFGLLHPATLRAFDVAGPVVAAEIFLDAIPARKGVAGFARTSYAPPALQPVARDFAFLVPATLPAADLLRTVRGAEKANIVSARVFDDFRGAGVPDGFKSLAIEVILQPGETSYTEADLKAIADRIVSAAAKAGASLRA
ncbi:phenylalanine--tRNA ligase subunit beta [Novosphingobium tardum]|uniref:Phenylalanine--tRNA ligase beta subunit n=1 Tax=Novosphingobium tardum TaxID=1538021 RepID=A0ABV8RM92_9SPHN